jgi:mercuric ion transport protein
MKSEKSLLGIGILTSITASLCCIMPILSIIAGTSGVLATFSWLEPFRPYLIGISIIALGFVWYQKLKSQKEIDCECALDKACLLAFPYYSSIFYTHTNIEVLTADKADLKTTVFKISGMTCANCEKHVYQEVQKLSGIADLKVSYEGGNAIIVFDKTKTNKTEIGQAIKEAGYAITDKTDH